MKRTSNLLTILCAISALSAQTPPALVGLGDSIGEGVQSLDANVRTQPSSYLNLLAKQLGVSFPLPLINTSILGFAGSTIGRSRVDPNVIGANLAVNGADTGSSLNEYSSLPASDETDLVLLPRLGSQVSIAESSQAQWIVCWLGNNDILGSVTTFDRLDASQITPLEIFNANFQQIVDRLNRPGSKLVFANIPDVKSVGFLFGRQDLINFLGSDYGLPEGSFTTLPAMLLIKNGLDDGSILRDPNWVLDPAELQIINTALENFNRTIAERTAAINAPVVDINSIFKGIAQNPLTIANVTFTTRYQGGLFSLDGVHPSDSGHALVANAFIETMNRRYNSNIPLLSNARLESIITNDPFVDFDGDLRVRGRFGAGLLETIAPSLGLSGDRSNQPQDPRAKAQRFMETYFQLKGMDPNKKWTRQDALAAMRDIFRFR